MRRWSAFLWLGLSILFSAIPPGNPKSCLECEPGFISENCKCVPCKNDQYWAKRNGVPRCNTCTASCNVKQNMIEITKCTKTSDRSCKCKAGFHCSSPVILTCRRDCEPCTNGFTKTPNLNISCQQYTNCTKLGMVTIKEGSSTADRVCGKPYLLTSPPNPNTLTAPNTSTPLSDTDPEVTPSPIEMRTYSDVTRLTFFPPTEGPVLPLEAIPKTTWIFLLLLLILLCVVSCLSLKCKSAAIKNKLEWAGLTIARYPVLPSANPNVENVLTVSDGPDVVRDPLPGQGSFPGKNQQVTMEHVGKADGINNTVGSIFIYSPGMVILGSNSNEKKEEAETSGEDGGEVTRLMSVPQQESSFDGDSIRLATQEELGKELSIPVPATSK
ncbi:uncharacterized protein Hap1MRO34_024888 isoform 2-T2 [Clarias gariepinus]|uniref:uncharacterized protein si:dkeyp-61b2.1 isoform X2 n=1 Tax=Clarias gariepinus TaxID=13013 RepID=UPI00234D462D|nr:uncharacterized protein si:dkeyp-61b2.1 isoform X2 [Clarias gariepinus]